MVCQICGKSGHLERFCPNAWKMGFLNRMRISEEKNEKDASPF
jgi:hypothetical protein